MTLTAKRWLTRILYAVPLALMLWHLPITGCRGAIIGLGVGILVCACLAVKRAIDLWRSGRLKSPGIKLWLVIALVAVLCIGSIGVVLLVAGTGVSIVDLFRRGIDTPYVTRTSIWQSAFRAFLDAPVLGVGKGNFEIATPQAHNEYLEIAVETGVVGFGAFIWFLICLGSRSLSLWRKDLTRQQQTILMSIMCGLTAVLVDSFVNFDFQTPACALSFFTLVGVIDVFGLEHEPRSASIPLRGRSLSIVRGAVWVLLPPLILLGALSIARPFKARLRIMSGSLAMSRGDTEEAARLFASAVRLTPWNWHVLYRLGNAYSTGGEHEKAVQQYEASLRANPNYVLSHANIGLAHFNSGDPEKALESARRALTLVPEFPMGHNVVGLCYAKQERWEEALEEFKAATALPKTGRRQLYRNTAYCHYKLGQLHEAVIEFERAIEASASASPELHVEKGGVLLEMKEYEKAVESLATGVNLFNAKKAPLASSQIMQRGCRQLARLYLETFKNPYLSSLLLIELSRSIPQDSGTRVLTDALFAYLAEHGFSFEGAAAAWYHAGGAYLHQGRNDEAEKALTLLIESGEPNVDILRLAYHDLALVIAMKGDYDRAVETVDKARTIAPDYAPLDDLRKRIVAEKESKGQPDQP
jgi:tetratricopeptide (TPR) repeat protein